MNAGICLNREGQGVVIVPTVRADLHWDRYQARLEHNATIESLVDKHGEFRPVQQPELVALVDLDSAEAAAKVASVLNQFWSIHGRLKDKVVRLTESDAEFTVTHLIKMWGLSPRTHAREERVIGWAPHDVTDFDEVPDPSMSPAEFWHRLAQGEKVEQFGSIVAPVNLTTLIGGLARIPRRKEIHEQAAKEYRSVYEHAILAGNPKAIDYGTAVQVDNSRTAFYSRSADASHRWKLAVRAIGMLRASVVDPIILHDESTSAVAKRLYGNPGGQARKRVNDQLREGLDILAVHFELVGTASGRRKVNGWLSERLPLDLPPVEA